VLRLCEGEKKKRKQGKKRKKERKKEKTPEKHDPIQCNARFNPIPAQAALG